MLQILQITYILHFISELVLFPGVFVYSLICLFPACMLDCVLYAIARPPQVDFNASSQHLRVWSSYSRQYSDVDSRPSVDQSINKVEKKKEEEKKEEKTHTIRQLWIHCLHCVWADTKSRELDEQDDYGTTTSHEQWKKQQPRNMSNTSNKQINDKNKTKERGQKKTFF